MKSLMKINEDMITVSSGGYDYLTTDNDATRSDKINRALLDDINTAAKRAGIKVTVTTAASGHGKLTKSGNKSRHTTNQAVDIAIMALYVLTSSTRNIARGTTVVFAASLHLWHTRRKRIISKCPRQALLRA